MWWESDVKLGVLIPDLRLDSHFGGIHVGKEKCTCVCIKYRTNQSLNDPHDNHFIHDEILELVESNHLCGH